jgi:anti-sigma regulatory factor (Ser/Thr protein kinase)
VDDDVALLVVRLQPLPEPFAFDMPSEPRSLLTIRAALRRWLTLMDAGEDEIYEILVAAGEACANAIEHATGPATGRFTIEGSREGNQVCIAVRDAGSWRPYRPGPGGRGLHVMESFMDRVDIERTDDGTEVKLIRNLHSVPALQ